MYRADTWTMHVTDAVGLVSLQVGSLVMLPGKLDPIKSSLSCPSDVVTGTKLVCIVTGRDTFGNIVPPTSTQSKTYLIQVTPAGAFPDVYPSLDGNGHVVNMNVRPGLAHIVGVKIFQRPSLELVGELNVTAYPVELSTILTSVRCNPQGKVVAGTYTQCTINAVDANGIEVIQSALRAAFVCNIRSSAGETIEAVTVHTPNTNQFTCSFTPKRVGSVVVRPTYEMSRTSSILLGTSPVGIKFAISPAKVASGNLRCTSIDILVETNCAISLFDQYNNPAGGADAENSLFIRAQSGTNEIESTTAPAFVGKIGKFTQSLNIRQSGLWSISIEYVLNSGRQVISTEPFEVSVASGPFASTTSTFTCVDVALGPKLSTECKVRALDLYSNAVDTLTIGSANGAAELTVRIALDQDVNNAATEMLLAFVKPSSIMGFYTIHYRTPVLPQTIQVSVLHQSTETFLKSEQDVTSTTEAVIVRTVELDAAATTVKCPAPTTNLYAGQPVDCIVSLFSNGNPLTEPSMAAVLAAKIDIGGLQPAVTITHQIDNRFVVRFVPTFLGATSASATLQVLKIESEGAFSRVGLSQSILIRAGEISPSHTKLLRCVSRTVGSYTFCDLETYDQHGNPSGRKSEATLFRLETLHTIDPTESSEAGTTVWDVPNRYRVRANLTKSQTWNLRVVHDAASPPTLIHDQEINVDASTPIAVQSNMLCDPEVLCGGKASCLVSGIDVFGNPTMFTSSDVSRFYPTFGGQQRDWSMSIVSVTGQAKLSFVAPVVASAIPVTMFLRDAFSSGKSTVGALTTAGSVQTVNAVQRDLSSTLSTLVCSSMDATVVAGDRISCTITATSPTGVLVSDTALIYAFRITVDDSGNMYRIDINNIEVVGAESGQFRFVVVPTSAGITNIKIEYLVGTTVQPLGNAISNTVIGAAIYPKSTIVGCHAHIVLENTTCTLQTFDVYGNRVGGIDEATALSAKANYVVDACTASAKEAAWRMWDAATCSGFSTGCGCDGMQTGWNVCTNENDVNHKTVMINCPVTCAGYRNEPCPVAVLKVSRAHSSAIIAREVEVFGSSFVRFGEYLLILPLRRAGSWSIVPSVNGQALALAQNVIASSGSIDPTAGFSSLGCPVKVPSGTKVSCTVLAYDTFGNAATTDIFTANAMSVNIRPSSTSYDIKTEMDGMGRYLIAFLTPTKGQTLTLSVASLSDITGNYTNIGATTTTKVAGTVLDADTSTFVCTPLSIIAGETVQCTILAYEAITAARPGASLGPAFSAVAIAPTEIMRVPDGGVQFSDAGIYQFSFSPRATTTAGNGVAVKVLYSNGPGSELELTFRSTIQVLPGSIDPQASEVTCDSSIQLPLPIRCTVLTFDAYKNPIDGTEHGKSFNVESNQVALQLGPIRASATATTVRVIELGPNVTVAEYTLRTTVTKAADKWLSQVSYGGVAMGDVSSTTVRAGVVNPSTSRVVCPETSPAMVAVSCDVSFFDNQGNGIDVTTQVPQESVDVLFRHTDDQLIDKLVPSVESSFGNTMRVSFNAPSYMTTLGAGVRLLSTPSRPSTSATPIGDSNNFMLNVTVTESIRLSSINSTVGCQSSGGADGEVAGTPILCYINAISTGTSRNGGRRLSEGVEVGSSALASAFVVDAVSGSGGIVDVSKVEFSGFGGRYTFTVRSTVASALSIRAFYNADGSADINTMTSMYAGSINNDIGIVLSKDVPTNAKLACVPSQSVGTIRCEVDVVDQYGNPSGSISMGNILSFEASDSTTGAIVRGSIYNSEKDWLNEGRYALYVDLTRASKWSLKVSFRKSDGTIVFAEYDVEVTAGNVDPSKSWFKCADSVFTSGTLGCRLHFADKYKNSIRADNSHVSNLMATVGSSSNTPLFYKMYLEESSGAVVVSIQAPAVEAVLSVDVKNTTTFTLFGGIRSISVQQAKISESYSQAYCSLAGIVGDMITCYVQPKTIQNVPVVDENFGSMLSMDASVTANKTAFVYKGNGLYFATFSPRYAARVDIDIGMSQIGSDRMRLHEAKIHVDVTHGPADLSRSQMQCRPAVRGSGGNLVAGDAVECSMSVFDSYSNPVTNSSLANYLELRAYDQFGVRQGFTGFKWSKRNVFSATMTVRTAGVLAFNATLLYDVSLSQTASVERNIQAGATDTTLSKFVCPTKLDVMALTSFNCFFFLVDSYQNPKQITYKERSTLHVKFGAGASPFDSSFIVRNNEKSVDDISFDSSLRGMRAQYVATLNVAPASGNETSIALSGHLHQNDLSFASIALVQTSPAELAEYSASMKCQKSNIVAGSSVSCTLRIRKSGTIIAVPSLAALLDVRVSNKQTTAPSVTKRAVGNKFILSFKPTASGDAKVRVYLKVGSGAPPRLLTTSPEIVPVLPADVDVRNCTVSMPNVMVAGQTDNITLSVSAFDKYLNKIDSSKIAKTFHARVVRYNHNDGGANDHPILSAVHDATTGTYTLRFPRIVVAGAVVVTVGHGAERDAIAEPFFKGRIYVTPTDVDPTTSSLDCPMEAVVGGQIECLVRLRDAYSNVVSPTGKTFSSLAAESILYAESATEGAAPLARAAPSMKSKESSTAVAATTLQDTLENSEEFIVNDIDAAVSVTFGFTTNGNANVSIGIVGSPSKFKTGLFVFLYDFSSFFFFCFGFFFLFSSSFTLAIESLY